MEEMFAGLDARTVKAVVLAALQEDGAFHDVTTIAVVPPGLWGGGTIIAKQAGFVAGLPVAQAAFSALDTTVSFDTRVAEGAFVEAGDMLADVEGPVRPILSAERVALNLMQRLSGIATITRAFVDAVAGTRARILDTRKTTPGLRHLERYAVRTGGGQNHRFGLSDGVLIKDNHIAAAASRGLTDIGAIVRLARASAPHTMRIEVEVTNLTQLVEALEGGADVILLDNMSPDQTQAAVERIGGRALVEASGGITLENARGYAEAGVDYISIGRLTHSAPAMDMSLEMAES